MARPPKLPALLDRKIYKTGQTRGADDDVIYQNRVGRNSTVLIPFDNYEIITKSAKEIGGFENGSIVLIKPEHFFADKDFQERLIEKKIIIGQNALLFYETRAQWNMFNPIKEGFEFANSRVAPLGGQYVARVPSNTSENAEKILHGYTTTSMKGAGIRVYEYASSLVITKCRIQLELLFWHCENSRAVAKFAGMEEKDIEIRVDVNLKAASEYGLDDWELLVKQRILSEDKHTICPLCLQPLSANGFFNRLEQAQGRDVPDLTVTELNLFHIRELRIGEFNHIPYNLGWGHHHCNVVTKDAGIYPTIKWMEEVLENNKRLGYIT